MRSRCYLHKIIIDKKKFLALIGITLDSTTIKAGSFRELLEDHNHGSFDASQGYPKVLVIAAL
jgi:hypothetical protein